jgi:hypothetical protein
MNGKEQKKKNKYLLSVLVVGNISYDAFNGKKP